MLVGSVRDQIRFNERSHGVKMENEKWNKEVNRLVQHYQRMELSIPNSNILYEVKWQYHNMSHGGDGGDIGITCEETGSSSCRVVNYPDHPNWVFQRVIEEMGWKQ